MIYFIKKDVSLGLRKQSGELIDFELLCTQIKKVKGANIISSTQEFFNIRTKQKHVIVLAS